MSDNSIKFGNMQSGQRYVRTPYHPDLPAKLRALGGKWNDLNKAWVYDPRGEERVRAAVESIFGSTTPSGRVVTVRWQVSGRYNPARLAGREIAWRPGRDTEVRLGRGVVVVEGEFPRSGGSSKYPALWNSSHPGVVVEIRDVDYNVAQRMVDEGGEIVG